MTEQAGYPPQQPIPGLREPARSSGKGCFFWGCLICAIIAVLFVGCVGFCAYMVYKQVRDYTSPEPIELPAYEVQPGEVEGIQARVESFETGEPGQPATLEITADDLNALLAAEGPAELKDNVFFRIEDDVLRAQVSVPIDRFVPFFSGRYFNGDLAVRPRIVNGQPVFDFESVKVGEKELPPEQLGQVLNQAVNDLLRDPEVAPEGLRAFLRQVESLDVRDGKLIFERSSQ